MGTHLLTISKEYVDRAKNGTVEFIQQQKSASLNGNIRSKPNPPRSIG